MKVFYLLQVMTLHGVVKWGIGDTLNEAILSVEEKGAVIYPQSRLYLHVNFIPEGNDDSNIPVPASNGRIDYEGHLEQIYYGEARHFFKPFKDAKRKDIKARKAELSGGDNSSTGEAKVVRLPAERRTEGEVPGSASDTESEGSAGTD